jgi:hypothetical protein
MDAQTRQCAQEQGQTPLPLAGWTSLAEWQLCAMASAPVLPRSTLILQGVILVLVCRNILQAYTIAVSTGQRGNDGCKFCMDEYTFGGYEELHGNQAEPWHPVQHSCDIIPRAPGPEMYLIITTQ